MILVIWGHSGLTHYVKIYKIIYVYDLNKSHYLSIKLM